MANYAHDENNNRIETLSKEQVYALLAAAIQQGQLPVLEQDTAFVTMVKSIVDGKSYKIGFCTQAQYNELEAQGLLEADALYIITDDDSYDDLATALTNLSNDIESINTTLTALQDALTNAETAIIDLQERVETLETKHLYRHDISIIGTGYGVYLTLYLNTDAQITSQSDLMNYIQNGKTIGASGYKSEDYVDGICPILSILNFGNYLQASYIRHKQTPTTDTEQWNLNLTGGTYTDTVTTLF